MRFFGVLVLLSLVMGACGGGESPRAGASPTAAARTATRPPAVDATATALAPLAYRDETGRYEVRYAQPINRLSRLVEGLMPESPFWRSQFQANVNELIALNQELRQLMSPPCYAAVHAQLMEAVRHFDAAGPQVERWLTAGDAEGLVEAIQGINDGGRMIRQARMRLSMTRC